MNNQYDNVSDYLADLGEVIKEKNKITETMEVADFPTMIRNISTGNVEVTITIDD